jgi:hypothetical protein
MGSKVQRKSKKQGITTKYILYIYGLIRDVFFTLQAFCFVLNDAEFTVIFLRRNLNIQACRQNK